MIGILAAALGLVPWWISGARLPLQNLWATQVMPGQMPLALLPLSQYEVLTIVALLTTGGAAAGFAIRVWSPVRRRLVTWCAIVGLLLVQVAATVQSFELLGQGLMRGTLAQYYRAGLMAGVICSILAAVVALLLIASKSTVATTIGGGLMAVPFTSWAVEWVVGVVGHTNVPIAVPSIAHWLPAIVVGCALAWCGVRPLGRLAVWVLNLAFLWVIPAVFTAVQSVLGTRVIAGDIPEMVLMGREVLTAALGPDGGAVPTVLLALALGLAGVGIRVIAARRVHSTT
ncbi:putative integral membrane protein [Arthrobacter sp. Rue61a]|nr:putative integral membrane protein [Arthrobacter sp. Rue61a]